MNFNYNYSLSLYDNIIIYINNKDYWKNDEIIMYDYIYSNHYNKSLNRKWETFFNYIKIKQFKNFI